MYNCAATMSGTTFFSDEAAVKIKMPVKGLCPVIMLEHNGVEEVVGVLFSVAGARKLALVLSLNGMGAEINA